MKSNKNIRLDLNLVSLTIKPLPMEITCFRIDWLRGKQEYSDTYRQQNDNK